ncbi:MAG TPA: AAA family ATPase, partial [Polyangiaceae bacterium]|nr:AAA family ATPase [Polyangiaceae bacterium]
MQRLYGRDDVLGQARRRVEQACAGHGQLLLFTGEPGIGKSRLAEHLAAEAASRGARVAFGRAWEAGGAPAYWPWIQVFRDLQLGAEPLLEAATPGLGTNADEARFVAFDRAARALRAAASEQPLALVLDDLHAADAASLLLLLLLARDLARSPILLIGTYRDAETRSAPELAALLAKVARHADVV